MGASTDLTQGCRADTSKALHSVVHLGCAAELCGWWLWVKLSLDFFTVGQCCFVRCENMIL